MQYQIEEYKKEKWRWVPEAQEYSVSSMGRCRSKNGKIRKQGHNSKGYLRVGLWHNRRLLNRSVHSLVAQAFIGARPKGYDICHLNGNKEDNRLDNIKYVTPKENSSHRVLHGTLQCGEKHYCAKLKLDDVRYILKNHKAGDMQSGYTALAKRFGVSRAAISAIVTGKRWTVALALNKPEEQCKIQ